MKIAALDSASRACSACVLDTESGAFACRFGDNDLNHSVTLLPALRAALDELGLTPDDVDRYAVTVGPGSFTGVKIGVAAVKGLAFVHDTPCVAVSSLCALAHGVREDGLIVALLDAKRNAFYNALFERQNGVLTRVCEDRQISADALADELKGPALLVGDGAPLFEKTCVQRGIPCRTVGREDGAISAYDAALLAADARTVPPHELMPVYLRPSQAERIRTGIQD